MQQEEKSGAATVVRSFVDGPFGQVHVRTARPKVAMQTPLYCVHQSPSSSVVYVPILEALGADRVVIAGDTPGYGESTQPPDVPEVADYARSHAAVIDQCAVDTPLDLLGYYTGSKIVVELALQRPDLVRRVILFGAVIYSDEELAEERGQYQPEEYRWDASHLMAWWKHLADRVPDPYPIDLFVRHFAEIQRGGKDSWWGHRAAFNYDLRDKLPRLNVPVLILCTEDPQGQKSKRALPLLQQGQLVELPYVGQGVLDLHTAAVCKTVREFLDHRPQRQVGSS